MTTLNRSICSISLLGAGLFASLGSTCGDIPRPIAENQGPEFHLNHQEATQDFDVQIQVDPTDLPLGIERYSHALIDLVPSADSKGLANVTIEDAMGQTILNQAISFDDGKPVQLNLDGLFDDCSEMENCSRDLMVNFDWVSGEMHIAWYLMAEMEAGEVWAEEFIFDIQSVR